MLGVVVEGFAVGHFHHPAQVHHHDAVAQVAHHRQIVGDEQIGQAQLFLQVLEQVDHLGLDRHVQGGYRLVADDQLRVGGQGPGDADALALAAGKFVRVAVGHLRFQAHFFQQPHDFFPVGGAALGKAVHAQRLADDVQHLHARVERAERVLVDHLHAPAQPLQRRLVRVGDVLAVEMDAAVGERAHAQHGQAGGGLAAAGFAHQPQGFAPVDVEGDPVHRFHGAGVAAQQAGLQREVHAQVGDLQKRFSVWHRYPPSRLSSGCR